jgi:hypothetical protein
MAIADSTGLNCYLVTSATSTATKAACATAIAGGKKIGKITSLGDIGGTRAVNEVKFLSLDDSIKSMGSTSYGNLSIETPFDSADVAGQAELKAIYADKTERKMIIENTDGTYTTLPVKCSSNIKTYAIDAFVMFKATVEQNGASTEVIA